MSSEDLVEVAFDKIVCSTYALPSGQALAHRIDFGFTTEWIPASQCFIYEKDLIVEMPEWLATEKELI